MENLLWMLREAAKPSGFTPNEASVVNEVKSLERRGWLYQLEAGPTWIITDEGKKQLDCNNS